MNNMLRALAISLITLFSPALYSCEKTPTETVVPDNSQKEQEKSGKALIVYYSFSGDCRAIASLLTIAVPTHILYGSDYPYVAAPALINAKKALEARLGSHGLNPQSIFFR